MSPSVISVLCIQGYRADESPRSPPFQKPLQI